MSVAPSKSERMVSLFKKFDTDGNGKLSHKELERILCALDKQFTSHDVAHVMKSVDRDRNGSVDYQEFVQWLSGGLNSRRLLPQVEASADAVAKEEAAQQSVLPVGLALGVCYAGEIKMWDLRSGEAVKTFGILNDHDRIILRQSSNLGDLEERPHLGNITCVAVSWELEKFITGSNDKSLKLWDFHNKVWKTFNGSHSEVLCVDVDWVGQRVLSGDLASELTLWDLASGKATQTIRSGNLGGCFCMQADWSRNRVVCGAGQKVEVWDFATQGQSQCLRTLVGHEDSVTAIVADFNRGQAISGSLDRSLRKWDLEAGTLLQQLTCENLGAIHCLGADEGTEFLVSGDDKSMLRVWDWNAGECVQALAGHKDCVISTSRLRCGNFLVSGSRDGTVRLWDRTSGTCVRTIEVGDVYGGVWITGIRAEPSARRPSNVHPP